MSSAQGGEVAGCGLTFESIVLGRGLVDVSIGAVAVDVRM